MNDQSVTPLPALEKGSTKARPETSRVTNLNSTPDSVEIVNLEGDSSPDDLNASIIYKGPINKRSSAISRQLTTKR